MKKTVFLTIAFLIVVVLALGLVACKRYEPVPDVQFTVDDDAVYTLDSISDDIEGLSVELVTDGKAEKVDYQVISSKVSDDGDYIEVDVSVAGEVRTVRLPYAGENASLLREELRPFYALLNKSEDKSYALTVSGDGLLPDTKEHRGFGVKAILDLEDAGARFALLSGTPNDRFVVTNYDNVVISIGDSGVKTELLDALFSELLANVELDPESLIGDEDAAGDEDATVEGEDAEQPATELDALTSLFKGVSAVMDYLDRIAETTSLQKLLGVTVETDVNSYVLTTNSKKLATLLQTVTGGIGAIPGIDLNAIFDVIDSATDGAFKEGKIALTFSVEIRANGVAFSCSYENKKTEVSGKVSAALEVSLTPFVIPGEESAKSDVEIAVPFSLPAKELDLNLKAVVHVKDLFDAKGKELATLSLDYKDVRDAIRVVLNDSYLYVDMTPLMQLSDTEDEEGEEVNASFYYAFEKEGKPVGFYDGLPGLIAKLSDEFAATDQDEDEFDGDDDDDGIPEDDPRFAYGFGCRLADEEDNVLVLPIGSTERDLRAKLVVFVMDEDGAEIPYDDYTVEDFDGSASFVGNVIIVFAPGYSASVDVRICDLDKIEMSSLEMEPKYYYPVGTTLEEAQENCTYGINMTDGTVFWTEGAVGLIITQAMSTTGDMLLPGGSFNVTGDYMVFVEKDGKSSMLYAHVYDPDNVVIEELDCDDSIEVWTDDTEEDIRERLYVTVNYDDGESEEIKDYEIEGFDVKGESFTVKYGTFSKTVSIRLADGASEEEEEKLDLTKYIRFVTLTDDGTVDGEKALAAAKKLLTDNADLIRSIYRVTWTSGRGITLNLAINDASDKDLLAVLNLFVGVPTEDGWEDFDAESLTELLNGMIDGYGMLDFKSIVKSVFGAEPEDILSDLTLTAELGWKGGISFLLTLGNNAEGETAAEYLRLGISVRTVSATPFVLTEEAIEKAQGIEELPMTAIAAVAKVFMS